jgi:flagellar basal body-associated protein FliL
MMLLIITLVIALLAGGAVVTMVSAQNQIASLRQQVEALERERAQDRELLEAVLLEDPGKVRRLMGRPPG